MRSPSLSQVAPKAQPSRAGRYEIEHEIARGGMGIVYRVLDRTTGTPQAMKRVALSGSYRRVAIEALEQEYQVLASLDHPRIIRVFDYGIDDTGPFYTMELLEGEDIRRAAPIPYRTAALYLRDVATSLSLLHGRRLLHRDLSPNNVRIALDGHCKLLDFGALTPFGVGMHVVGTPPLIAPEVLRGAALDQRTDLYALGGLAYFMLTGKHAYPARALADLQRYWATPPPPPSSLAADVPKAMEELVLSLMHADPLARPSSAAEVIARLDVIAELPAEDSAQTARLAQSFFASPHFTGRSELLREASAAIDAAVSGKGAALRIEAVPGMGRTRLLEEVGVRARLAGATVLFADAAAARQHQGTARALVSRTLELLPEFADGPTGEFRAAIASVGIPRDVAALAPKLAENTVTPRPLAEFFAELSRERPLVIEVDNVEDCDDASQGLLASLANLAGQYPLLLVVAEARTHESDSHSIGAIALRRHSRTLELAGFADHEMLQLLRSIFSDAPNLERFADWLQARAAGSPLHAIELCRRLFAQDVIRYASGLWTLPAERPDTALPGPLGDALSVRLSTLSDAARALAECLSLQRDRPTLALCALLCGQDSDPNARARELVDALIQADVLRLGTSGHHFSSSALRSALLAGMNEQRLEQNHQRLGEALASTAAASGDVATRIEAGFHLIEGADALRGADLIASATHDSDTYRMLLANLYHGGHPIEAAYKVYVQHRRSLYERVPLMAALAQAGYYESRYYGERYGDEALDALETLTGLHLARNLRRILGRPLALIAGLGIGYLRFLLTPRKQRPYSFRELLKQLFGSVIALCGVSALSLDAERTTRVAAVLQPFAFLPERMTAVGLYEFCSNLSEIARENEVTAYATFERMLSRFSSLSYYPWLTHDARVMLLAATHFARGSFALFRADGSAALQSAAALDSSGLKLYAMIASQLRYLYYAARGEFSKGAPHREQVELHAAHVGSAWQVETWEAAALTLIYSVAVGDVVSATRIVHRLDEVSRDVPTLKRYRRLASDALIATHRDRRTLLEVCQAHEHDEPRSFIGWAAAQGAVVRAYNQIGEHALAKAHAERALAHVTDADRELVSLFLPLDIHMAYAEAGLGDVDAAMARLDGLIARFEGYDHPLLQGMLHEARAEIAWHAKRNEAYQRSMVEVERWYRVTGTPALIAKCERLAALATPVRLQSADADVTAPGFRADDLTTGAEERPA